MKVLPYHHDVTMCDLCPTACGSISSVGAMGSTLAVEREWAKALCQGDSAALASLNSGVHAWHVYVRNTDAVQRPHKRRCMVNTKTCDAPA